jgi:translation initiation factor 3 subunit B
MSKKKDTVQPQNDEDYVVTEQDIRNFNPDEKFTFDEKDIVLDQDVSNIVAIDDLPISTEDKAGKMQELLVKILQEKAGAKVLNSQLPIDNATKKTKGFAFFELATKQQVDKAIKEIEGYKFGKNALHLIPFTDFDKYEKVEDGEFVAEVPKPLKERDFLRGWLLDENARDQFIVRHYDVVEVYWHDVLNKQVREKRKEKWSDGRVAWSPYGSYVVTYHDKGIALWGGDDWKPQGSFSQKNVALVDFSPRESFIVTMNENQEDNVVVFDTLTQKKKRTFTAPYGIAKAGSDGGGRWPVYKWSHDEKYLARQGRADDSDPRRVLELAKRKDLDESLYIYDTSEPSMPLLNKKAMKIEGLRDFAWMPSQGNKPAVLAYVAQSYSDTVPSRVALLEFPRLREIRTQPFFKATAIRLVWHESGDFLAVLADREIATKSGKTEHTTVEVFVMGGKGIPIETIEFKDKIFEFKWEPKGKRFVAIHGDAAGGIKKNVSFYNFKDGAASLIKKFENKILDRAYWSPRGVNVVLVNSKAATVPLEFYDTEDGELVGVGEHFGMTNAEWDPTGRYFVSFVSAHVRAQENGYIIWTFLGAKLHHATFDKMWEFQWRPRPPTLLTSNDMKKIQRNLPALKKQYEKEKQEAQNSVAQETLKVRRRLWTDFEEILERLKAEYDQMKAEREKIRGYASDDETEVREELVEEVISREEVLVEE